MDLHLETRFTCPSNVSWETKVKGSNGKTEYIVSFNNGHWSCSCKGYQYRSTCRHIDKANESRCGGHWEAFAGGGPHDPGQCSDCSRSLVPIRIGV